MKTFLILSFAIAILGTTAQTYVKKPLEIKDIPDWKTIGSPQISGNGRIILYEINPLKGDGKLVYHMENHSDTIDRGYSAAIGSENDFMVYRIKQSEATFRKAKKDKVSKEKMPKDSLGILILGNKENRKYPNLISYKLPEENTVWIAFLCEQGETKKDTSKAKKDVKEKKTIKQPGNNLVLLNVKTLDTLLFQNITDYVVSKKSSSFSFIQEKKDSLYTYSTLLYFDPATAKAKSLFSMQGTIKKTVLSEKGDFFAFLFSQDTIKEKVYALYYGARDGIAQIVVDSKTPGIPIGWSPSEYRDLQFSENGSKLYLGTAPTPKPEPKDTLLEEEKAVLDVWNWKDLKLQPQQKLEVEREKNRTYLAVFSTIQGKFTQLADVMLKDIATIQKGNGDTGLGSDDTPYLRASSWTGRSNRDYYLVDLKSGIKRQMLTDKSFAQLSPQGKYLVWYDSRDSCWYSKSTNIDVNEVVAMTKNIPVTFCDEENDIPDDARPYGIAGWSDDDKFIFIYDRYDIWRLDPSGEKVPVCATKAFGRRNATPLRYIKTDHDLETIPTTTDILLSARDERTAAQGYFSTKLNQVKDPELLMMDNFAFGNEQKAKNADKIIWTKQNVTTFPDIWISTISFKDPKKISYANPGQKEFIWPTVETVEWYSFSGEKLKGLLYKPENMDAQKKYPMIIYYYERNFETRNNFQNPSPSSSTINKTFYTSNGYLVFIPDITYKTGYPGQSAYNAIVSGAQHLIQKYSFVDKDKIGLQGQSWGGYQTAYLITQTDMFAAAMAGAPVSNMISAYGGIRWESGMSRMFQYEHAQSRIGGTLWEKPLQYIENSPLFYAPKVNTPLLMMHNDADGAVPWYQGIEMFVALRRLDKPVWMLTYNNEPHNLKPTSWANRIDLTKRMFDFFEHYLKGKPMPEWMEKGVPAIEKGKK